MCGRIRGGGWLGAEGGAGAGERYEKGKVRCGGRIGGGMRCEKRQGEGWWMKNRVKDRKWVRLRS